MQIKTYAEFFGVLLKLYPNSFKQTKEVQNRDTWYDAYKTILTKRALNYDRMYELMVSEWESKDFAPPPQWFTKRIGQALLYTPEATKYKTVEILDTKNPNKYYPKGIITQFAIPEYSSAYELVNKLNEAHPWRWRCLTPEEEANKDLLRSSLFFSTKYDDVGDIKKI